jgi:hypothetical protein
LEEFNKRAKTDGSTVAELMAGGSGMFLVATSRDNKEIKGCIYVEWLTGELGTIRNWPDYTHVYSYSMLSVPDKFGGQGIG